MRESLLVSMNFIFTSTDINRIETLVETQDKRQQDLLTKLGFINEGEMRQYKLRDGKLRDMGMWSILRRDWEKK